MKGLFWSIVAMIVFAVVAIGGVITYEWWCEAYPQEVMSLPAEKVYCVEGRPFEDKSGATVQIVSSEAKLYLVFVKTEPFPKRFAVTRKNKEKKLALVNLDPSPPAQ